VTGDEIFEAIAAHRSRLIDQLEPLTVRQWNTPSLCDGWEVRFARERGDRYRSDLLTKYRDLVVSRRAPSRIGPMSPLMDVTVHSLDDLEGDGIDVLRSRVQR
jgi:hypothetical protein